MRDWSVEIIAILIFGVFLWIVARSTSWLINKFPPRLRQWATKHPTWIFLLVMYGLIFLFIYAVVPIAGLFGN